MENTGHYKWEMLRLTWDRWARCLVTDKFITQFSNGFKGSPRDERGLLDAGVSQQYYQEYVKAQGNAYKEANWVQVPDTSFQLGMDENGAVSLRGPGAFGGYQFTPEQWTSFLRTAMSLQAGADPLTTPGFGGTSSSNISPSFKDDRPEIKRRMLQNLEAMEKFARSSSQYPKSK